MLENLKYDLFLSQSSKEERAVGDIAEGLRTDELRVWEIEAGLEHSLVMVSCMSANASGSDWSFLHVIWSVADQEHEGAKLLEGYWPTAANYTHKNWD